MASALAHSLMNRQMSNYRRTINLNQDAPPITQSPPSPAPKRKGTKSSSSTTKRSRADFSGPRLKDIGGLDEQILLLLELVALPILHPEVYVQTRVKAPRGVLLCGPPGTGKTMLANSLAAHLGVPFITVSAPSIVSGMSGESERALRDRFEEASKVAPSILFIDEIDAITPKRETAQREMERRIVAQLLTCLDDLDWEKSGKKPVLVLGATNRPDSLDPALRRAGRFDREIELGVPDEAGREQILRARTSELNLPPDFDFKRLARSTPGYVGADLAALVSSAGITALKRIVHTLPSLIPAAPSSETVSTESTPTSIQENSEQNTGLEANEMAVDENNDTHHSPTLDNATATPSEDTNNNNTTRSLLSELPSSIYSHPIATFLREHPDPIPLSILSSLSLLESDFQQALSQVQPSSQREGFTTIPNTTWSDIGALDQVRDELRMAIVEPIRNPEVFSALGVESPCGVLLWGPPGCGKTLLARAVANESGANFIGVKGPELLNKYVGESERAVRQVFQRARASAPCVIFFDELDALVPKRDDNLSEASARVVNTLLTELDGLEPLRQVYVLGATNRPDILDPAMTRPGRLDKLLYIDLPQPSERLEILKAVSRKTKLDDSVNLELLATNSALDGFSGADLNNLVREAASAAVRETILSRRNSINNDNGSNDYDSMMIMGSSNVKPIAVEQKHFQLALNKVAPSVSEKQRNKYSILHTRFSGQPLGKSLEAEKIVLQDRKEEEVSM